MPSLPARDDDEHLTLETIRLLVGEIAHDFNNLLLIISASAEFLKAATPPEDPRQADIQHIRTATTNAAELAWQLLAFSRGHLPEHDEG